jgi:hypothetical protein
MITVSLAEPRVTRVLPRGNWLDETGPIVEPAWPAFLGDGDASTGEATGASDPAPRATRLDLARWLTDTERGSGLFTSRVMVNRLWYLLFGAGLTRSLDDFGGQGQPPDHPELLDRLAHEFVRSGWDLKYLVRLMVTSRAYRQASVGSDDHLRLDPENRLFARQNRYRLPAEMVRDVALLVSGLLVQQVGGASARPYQPADYYQHLNFPERKYVHDTDEQQWRRGVYVHWQRRICIRRSGALDAPSREECTAERPRSNTPLAALALLNDPTFVEAARHLAGRLLADDAVRSDAARLELAVRSVLSRPAAA